MRSIEEWKSIIDNQKKSNLSILDYCKNNNISKSCFYKAKAKIEDSKIQIIKLKSNSVNTNTISLMFTLQRWEIIHLELFKNKTNAIRGGLRNSESMAVYSKKNGKIERTNYEIDFIADAGSRKIYIPDKEKMD